MLRTVQTSSNLAVSALPLRANFKDCLIFAITRTAIRSGGLFATSRRNTITPIRPSASRVRLGGLIGHPANQGIELNKLSATYSINTIDAWKRPGRLFRLSRFDSDAPF